MGGASGAVALLSDVVESRGANDNLVCTSDGCALSLSRGVGASVDRSLGGLRRAGDSVPGDGWGVNELRAGSLKIIFLRGGRGGDGGGDGDGGSLKLESVSTSMSSSMTLRPRLRGDVSGLTLWRRDGPVRLPPRRGTSSSLRAARDEGALGGGETELDMDGVVGRLVSRLNRGLRLAFHLSE